MSTINEMEPIQAWKFLQENTDAVLLDVRSTMEYQYVGHPSGAIHVPLMEPPEWQLLPDFVAQVTQELQKLPPNTADTISNRPVLTICRSGKRSATAAHLLLQSGFTRVWNVCTGFEGDLNGSHHRNTINGWRYHQLPWEQS